LTGWAVTVTASGGDQTRATLQRMRSRAAHMLPAFDAAHDALMRAIDYQYGRNAPAVGGWVPASPEWVEWKTRRGLDPRTLHMTLRLRRSLTQAGGPDHVYRPALTWMAMGTRVPYAGPLQERPDKNWQVAPLTLRVRGTVAKIMADWLFADGKLVRARTNWGGDS